MDGNDEIIFSGSYKDFRLSVRYGLDGKNEQDVAAILNDISSRIEPFAYKFSGIDTKKVSDFADPGGTGLDAVCSFLERTPAGMIKGSLSKAVPKPELMDAAESYFLNRLLTKADVRFKAPQAAPPLNGEDEGLGDTIAFIGKYKSWISIKKLGLEGAQDYEVSGILSGVNFSIVNKAFDFSGNKTGPEAAESISKGKRRSIGNIALCLKDLAERSKGAKPDPYLVLKVLDNLGYKPYASPDMLTDAYPDIKAPKVRGRKPKG